jgi:hypothetical protein
MIFRGAGVDEDLWEPEVFWAPRTEFCPETPPLHMRLIIDYTHV